jgi:hypothetical protein
MKLKTTGIALRTTLILWAGLALAACSSPPGSPEAEIRAWVAEGQRLAEEKERNALVDMISPAYRDGRGNERDDVENMFRVYFMRQNNIELVTSIEDIRVFGDTAAELDLMVGMAGTNDGVLGFSANAYNFELELVREGGEWLLIAGRWGEVGGEIH